MGGQQRLRSDFAYERLKEMIITLELAPGAALAEQELMRALKVGRTPLRDAIQRLAMEGLVEVVPRQGTFVVDADVADLRSILELRLVLEPLCAALAAQRATPEDLETMRRLVNDPTDPADPRYGFKVDMAFHRALAHAAQNPRLAAILEALQGHSFRFFRYLRAERRGPEDIRKDHARITEAVAERDPEKASALMRAHVEEDRDLLLAALTVSAPATLI